MVTIDGIQGTTLSWGNSTARGYTIDGQTPFERLYKVLKQDQTG